MAIIAGFFVIGSPKEQQLLKLDNRRVSDLQFLQSEILNFWQAKNRLPQVLSDLKDDIRGISVPKDPETGAEYGYEVRAPQSFALCATFVRASVSNTVGNFAKPTFAPGAVGENWEHQAGSFCFERKIDKEFYPPFKTPTPPPRL